MTWRNAESVASIESVDDDALNLILTALPANDARAAFSVSKRFAAQAACAQLSCTPFLRRAEALLPQWGQTVHPRSLIHTSGTSP